MKYFVFLEVEQEDPAKNTKSIYEYATADEAIASFHKNLGAQMNKDGVTHVLCMAINSNGGIYKNEAWNAPAPIVDEVTE